MSHNRIGIEMDLQRRKQDLLMDGCGVTRKTVWSWINNEKQPNIFHLKRISELLGRSMEELVELTKDEDLTGDE